MRNMCRCSVVVLIFAFWSTHCTQRNADPGTQKDVYLGQGRPGKTAEIFAPGIVSTESGELNIIISPRGDEVYFSRKQPDGNVAIMVAEKSGGSWQSPHITSFSGIFNDMDPSMTQDGMKIYFGSTRPSGQEKKEGCDIWVVEKDSDGRWSEAKNLGSPVNTPRNENYPLLAENGSIYFLSSGHGGYGGLDIFRSEPHDGKFRTPENLGSAVNGKTNDFDPYIYPDESTLIFSSSDRPDGYGSGDLYVCFRKPDGLWTEAANMGPRVNSSSIEYCPKCSPDGRYFFFTSGRSGNGDIYWMDAAVIDSLRSEVIR